MKECHVFVTGATGIVGSWLVKKLVDEGAYVVALVHNLNPQSELLRSKYFDRVNVVQGGLHDIEALERAITQHEIETVYHLGAQTIVGTAHRSPLMTFEANIRGTYNLLEICRRYRDVVKAIVVASSDKAYGSVDPSMLPYTEDMPLRGRNPYDVSKSCTDLLAISYAETYGLPITIARCGNIYGGGDLNWSRIVPGTIRSLLLNKRPIIRSDGKYTRDYIYVKDIVDAYILLANRSIVSDFAGEAFNFSMDHEISVLELTNLIQKIMQREDLSPVIQNKAQGEIVHQTLDSSKAKKMLGWKPAYSLEQGISETIKWYKEYLGGNTE